MVKLKDKLKKAAGAGLVIAATGGAGAAAALALKNKMEKTTYNINSWGPQGSDLISLKYGPPSAFDTADKLTIAGTPFDGQYGVVKGRSRSEVWIKPAQPITQSGSGGTIRAKTSVPARLRHLHSATLAKTRDTAKATGKAVKKGFGAATGFIWKWVKRGLIAAVIALLLYLIVTTVIKAKVTQAVAPGTPVV
jgi:hypothetical protein